jgi:serine/threonine-protein kinase RsbW
VQNVNAADAELVLPAESAYVAVLRMTTAGLAARLDFTLDDIEDLRMAVGEACGLVLDGASGGGTLRCHYRLGEGRIEVSVAADHRDTTPPDRDSFGWQVLSALVDDLDAATGEGRRRISFAVTSVTT